MGGVADRETKTNGIIPLMLLMLMMMTVIAGKRWSLESKRRMVRYRTGSFTRMFPLNVDGDCCNRSLSSIQRRLNLNIGRVGYFE